MGILGQNGPELRTPFPESGVAGSFRKPGPIGTNIGSLSDQQVRDRLFGVFDEEILVPDTRKPPSAEVSAAAMKLKQK